MINVMHDTMVEVFEHLEIMYKIELYIRIKYTERILRGAVLKNLTGTVGVQGIS